MLLLVSQQSKVALSNLAVFGKCIHFIEHAQFLVVLFLYLESGCRKV